jgi:parvulin-like peptidyl-prolyl isomerase
MKRLGYLLSIVIVICCVTFGCKKGDKDKEASEDVMLEEVTSQANKKLVASEASPLPASAVAVVNDQTISTAELTARLQAAISELNALTPPDEYTVNRLREEALTALVKNLLISQQARKQGVVVTAEEFQKRVQEVQAEYNGQDIQTILQEQGKSYDEWEKAQQETLLLEKLVDLNMGSMIVVADEEVRQYYERNQEKYDYPAQVRASQILVYDMAIAEKALQEIQNGGDFADIARQYSESPDASNGGDLGFFAPDTMPPEFDQAIFSLKMGEISDIVKTPYGYQIFKLTGHREARRVSFEEAKEQITSMLKKQKRMFAYDLWIADLQKNSKIVLNQSVIQQVK